MLALLDVGNTSISYVFYQNGRFSRAKTHLYHDIPKIIRLIAKSGGEFNTDVVLSSVVPRITAVIQKSVKQHKNLKLWIAGSNLKVPLKHKYKDINKLGMDRQISLFGAQRIYRTPLLVIDYGTAITADYVDKAGVFQGGMIIPGPELAFQALISRAARISSRSRLPKRAASFLGRDTQACMNSGILEGYGAMTDGLIQRFRAEHGRDFRVILTGGFANHLKPYIQMKNVYRLDPLLIFKSMQLLHQNHCTVSKQS